MSSSDSNVGPYGDLSNPATSKAPKPNAPVGPYGDLSAPVAPKGTAAPKVTAPKVTKPAQTGAAPKAEKKTFVQQQEDIKTVGATALNSLMTPMYWVEDLAYRLATPTTSSERKRMDATIAKKGYLGWMADEWATSAKNATAWTTGGEVKHTGGAIAKRLGWTAKKAPGSSDEIFNTVVGTAIDVALDPLTYVPGVNVFKGLELLGKVGTKAVSGAIKGVRGEIPEWAAKKLVTEDAQKAAQKNLLTQEQLDAAKRTQYTQKGIIKPNNKRPVGETGTLGMDIQQTWLKKLSDINTNMVKLPNAVDRTIGDKVFDATLTSIDNGIRAAKDVIFSTRANYKLSEYAAAERQVMRSLEKSLKKKAGDYTYHTGANAAEEALAPKPSEVAIEAPAKAAAKRSRVTMPEAAPAAYEDAMKGVGVKDANALQSVLSTVDKLAKETVGVSATGRGLGENVARFIQSVDSKSNAIFKRATPEIQRTIKEAIALKENFSPKELFNEYKSRVANGNKEVAPFVSAYGNKVFKFSTGAKSVGSYLAESGDTPFLKLPEADQLHLMNGLTEFTSDSSKANLKKLGELVPDKNALDALVKAGALEGARGNQGALKALLSDLEKTNIGGVEKRYNTGEDIISGLRAGDSIPAEQLLKIMKALDPSNKVLAKFEKSATKPSAEMLSEMLKNPAGIELTLTEMRKSLAMMNPDVFLSSTGVGFLDTVSAYLSGRVMGMAEVTPAIHSATREYAARALTEYSEKEVKDTTEILRDTFGQRFDEAAKLKAKPGGHERVSSLTDIATLGAEKPYAGEAILTDQTNQSFQTVLVAKLLGRNTWRLGKKMEKMDADIFASYNAAEDKIQWFTLHMAQMRETLLATTGSRFFIQKDVKSLKFDVANNRHLVYIDMGDIVETFAATPEGRKVIENALFTPEKRDSLDFTSLMNVTRQVLEAREKGLTFDIESLNKTAGFKAKGEVLSASYKASKDRYASDYVQHLITVAAPDLEAIHLKRAQAAVEDWVTRSQDISHQMIDLLREGWVAATKGGYATKEEMFSEIQSLFNRFAYVSDVIRQQDGQVAEAVMRATSMLFIKGGKVLDSSTGDALSEIYHLVPNLGDSEYGDFMELLNSYARHEDPLTAAPVGRERLPKPHPDVVDAAAVAYQKAKDAYVLHAKAGLKLSTKEALKEWKSTAAKIQKDLAKARNNAYKAWLPIEHYSNQLRKFVPVEAYDHAAEVAWAEAHPPRLIGDSLEKTNLLDTAVEKVEGAAGNGGEVAAARAAAIEAGTKRSEKQAAAYQEDAAVTISESWDAYDNLGLDPFSTVVRAQEDAMKMQVEAHVPMPRAYAWSPRKTAGEGLSISEKISQKMSGTSGELVGYRQIAESKIHAYRASLARVLNRTAKAFPDMTGEDWANAIVRALDKSDVDEMLDANHQVFQSQIIEVVSSFIHDAKNADVNLVAFASRLKSMGLSDENGFAVSGSLENFMRSLPFMPKPKDLKDGTAKAIKWAQRQQKFKDSPLNPAGVLIDIGTAVHHVRTVQGLASSVVSNTSHEAYFFDTAATATQSAVTATQKAIAAGWVKLTPTAETELNSQISKDALFHPTIAKQIAALDREWTALIKGANYGKIDLHVKTMMRFISWWKFTQTALNPRHHVGNALGEYQAELMQGNFDPENWKLATKVNNELTKMLWNTDYASVVTKDMVAPMDEFLGHEIDSVKLVDPNARYTKGGKDAIEVRIRNRSGNEMPVAEFAKKAKQNGTAVSALYHDQVSNFFENMIADTSASGAQKQMAKSMLMRTRIRIEQGMKPFGDAATIYSNHARMAGAVRIARSRIWDTEEQMWAEIAKKTSLYHPTIQSLTSGERKWGRLFVGYYTWLRVAHTMFFDLLVNHTSSITMMPKILSNVRQSQGIEQKSPGNPWATGSFQNVPMNMMSSPYGPVIDTEKFGRLGVKTYNPAMDVLETYQFFYDPSANQNISDIVGENAKAGQALLGMMNPLVRQVGQEAVGADFATGQPYYDRSLNAVRDRFLNTLGPSQLLQGLGAYTPVDKTYGYTQESKDLKIIKWLFGGKEFVVNDPGLRRAAQKEVDARLKVYLKNQPEENK